MTGSICGLLFFVSGELREVMYFGELDEHSGEYNALQFRSIDVMLNRIINKGVTNNVYRNNLV
jgi:hypothetical protein